MFESSLTIWVLFGVLTVLVILLGLSVLAGHIIAIHRFDR